VTDSPGARDHVEDGVNGLIVPPGDPPALSAALDRALDRRNAAAMQAIAERARHAARDRFSPRAHIDALLAVVARVIVLDG
jgi:glycosyltransferase involved in cell wall biosynthesis